MGRPAAMRPFPVSRTGVQPHAAAARRWRRLQEFFVYAGLVLASLFFLGPIIWTVLTSLKVQRDALAIPPVWWFSPRWENYPAAWGSQDFARSFFNTVVVGLATVLVSLVLAVPAAYAFARHALRGKGLMEIWFLLVRMLPEMLFIIPLYALYRRFHLYDTLAGLVLVFQIYNLPYSIWMLRQFITEIPYEIEEAARMDGCSEWQVMTRITTPLIAPGLVAAAILAFIVVWTNLLFPLALTYNEAKIISIAVANFKGYGAFNWPVMAAASIIAIVPQAAFFLFIQRHLVRGLTLGAVKG